MISTVAMAENIKVAGAPNISQIPPARELAIIVNML
jgi:hypothetical protein